MKISGKKGGGLSGKWKGSAAAVVCILSAAFCLLFYSLGTFRKMELKKYDGTVTLVCAEGNVYSYAEAEEMRKRSREEEEPLPYVLWGSVGEAKLQNEDLGRYTETETLVVEGSSSLLLSSGVVLDGTVEKSCLIGEGVAQSLFGVADATGLSVETDGSEFVVLGMLEDVRNGAAFLAEDFPDVRLDRMNVRMPDDVALSSLEQIVEGQTGFAGSALDYRFLNSLTGLAGFGLCLLLWLWLLRLILTELKEYHRRYALRKQNEAFHYGRRVDPAYVKGLVIRLGILAGIIVILGAFVHFRVKIPEDMIPAQWSDFEFWSRLADDKKERVLLWIRCGKRVPELLYLGRLIRTILCFTFSYLCYIILRAILFGRNTGRKARG